MDSEVVLFETVRGIRDWVDSTFCRKALQERLQRKGHLKERFHVNLSTDMWQQLQVFIRASFALKGLEMQRDQREVRGKVATYIEVTLSAEARELYASKNPDIANGKMEAGKVKPKSEMDPECSPPRKKRRLESKWSLEEAKLALAEQDEASALRWLKALAQRRVTAQELQETR
ncbi:unnamed protein product, partial [Effrenium voratum]